MSSIIFEGGSEIVTIEKFFDGLPESIKTAIETVSKIDLANDAMSKISESEKKEFFTYLVLSGLAAISCINQINNDEEKSAFFAELEKIKRELREHKMKVDIRIEKGMNRRLFLSATGGFFAGFFVGNRLSSMLMRNFGTSERGVGSFLKLFTAILGSYIGMQIGVYLLIPL